MSQGQQDDWLKTHLLTSVQGLERTVGQVLGEVSSLRGEMVGRVTRLEMGLHQLAVRRNRGSTAMHTILKHLPLTYLLPVVAALVMGLIGWMAPDQVQGVITTPR